MRVQAVVKAGMVVGEHPLGEDISRRYDDTHEYFEIDNGIVPLYEAKTSSLGRIDTLEPMTDPRLRTSVEHTKEIQVQILKRWCGDLILKYYPYYKQINLAVVGGEDFANMRAFIDGIRSMSNTLEAQINTMQNSLDVLSIDYRDVISNSVIFPEE